ncbi:MAG: hypothetical protein OXT67_02190 [Zetaproteobacteria bacterium]|nr:hypothetical protein [Zetaproteobacteria bacterium]
MKSSQNPLNRPVYSSQLEKKWQNLKYCFSLDPKRSDRISSLELCTVGVDFLKSHHASPAKISRFEDSCYQMLQNAIDHYPENIFWDLQYLITAFANAHLEKKGTEYEALIHELLTGYGVRSKIKFQFLHDFIYGFDWARWVADDPKTRSHVPPFGLPFLHYMANRKAEILQLIAVNHCEYPDLSRNNRPRNRYKFDRSPPAETRMLRFLAKNHLLPLKAWNPNSQGRWAIHPTKLRNNLANLECHQSR